jgi:hypothetical protein
VPAGISLRKPAALGFAQAAGLLGSGTTAPHALEAVGVQVVADRAWTYSDPSVPSPGDSVESVAGSGSSLTAAPVRPRWRTIHARLIGQGGRSGAGGFLSHLGASVAGGRAINGHGAALSIAVQVVANDRCTRCGLAGRPADLIIRLPPRVRDLVMRLQACGGRGQARVAQVEALVPYRSGDKSAMALLGLLSGDGQRCLSRTSVVEVRGFQGHDCRTGKSSVAVGTTARTGGGALPAAMGRPAPGRTTTHATAIRARAATGLPDRPPPRTTARRTQGRGAGVAARTDLVPDATQEPAPPRPAAAAPRAASQA